MVDAVVQMLRSGQDDLQWFDDNIDKLKSRFNNRFVAFSNQEIIDSDTNLDHLMRKLDSKNIDKSKVFVRFVSKIKTIL